MNRLSENVQKHLELFCERYPTLVPIKEDILNTYTILEECYKNGGKLLIAGNGGSAADAEHIVGELMKKFKISRPVPETLAEKLEIIDPVIGKQLANDLEQGLMAIPLVAHEALTTAYLNDVGSLSVYAQQLYGYGRPGDVFLGISTSGNSQNILYATVLAKAIGMKTIGLTGRAGGNMSKLADITIRVPADETYMIQELHLPVYHCLCLMLEEYFFGR
ncbi:SIS domain-containing protein [Desulfotomaculum sp. OF05-3]|uniref:D-sedoheptulose-7-phosphate isomerase n=1 Tax=Desulfotomaculum sp. OF05-3 TaxID=2305243 RepID=UPI0001CE6C71|nr:SIS domain-containing protein [Desulfotomaculum sp. OF05-3]RGE09436.1 SIS domain-containing protein [Desulfotomaculum sp. OF05-3]CBL39990.1 Phosphoheptose isomerase [butyrate-producing bacterium SS3/4]